MSSGTVAVVLLADTDSRIVDASGVGLGSLAPRGAVLVGSLLGDLESDGAPLFPPDRLEGASRVGEARYEVRGSAGGDGFPFVVHLRSLEIAGTRFFRASVSRSDGEGDHANAEDSRARESLLRAIIDNLPFEFFARDRNEVCFLENQALARHWGSLLGTRPEDSNLTPEDLALWKATNRRALAGEVVRNEVQWEVRGELRTFEDVIAPIRLDGEILGFLGMGIDVTDRNRAEEGLRKREAEIRALVENTEDRIWSVDPGCHLVVSNHHFDDDVARTLGRPLLPGESVFHDALPADLAKAWRNWFGRALAGESLIVETKTEILGRPRWMEDRVGPIRDESGEVTGVTIASRDVTEAREARAALERETAMERALSELYRPVVSPETDIPAIARVVFEQALRLTGSPFAFVSEVDPETGAASPHVLSGMMEIGPGGRLSGEPVTFPRGADGLYGGLWGHPLDTRKGFFTNSPAEHPTAHGTPPRHVPLERFLAVPVLAGDELVGEIAVANAPADYTDRDLKAIERLAEFYALGIQRKRVEAHVRSLAESLETRVRERTAELLAANRELEAFSYSVSHDLRAPLRAIVGFMQAVLEDNGPSLPAGAIEDLGRAVSAAHRMSQLIDGLLGLSRLTRREMQRRPVDLSVLAHEIIDEQRTLHPGRIVETVVEDGLATFGDRELLRLVLRNLLENAWKFTSMTPGARIEFGTTASEPVPSGRREGQRVFFVRDNGAGFDMAYVEKLFRPFHRLHAEAEFPGSGIGLASAQRIVDRHGGTIWAKGAPGAGATFFFALGERG